MHFLDLMLIAVVAGIATAFLYGGRNDDMPPEHPLRPLMVFAGFYAIIAILWGGFRFIINMIG